MMIAYGPLNYKVPLFYKFTYVLQGRGAGLLLGGKGKKRLFSPISCTERSQEAEPAQESPALAQTQPVDIPEA